MYRRISGSLRLMVSGSRLAPLVLIALVAAGCANAPPEQRPPAFDGEVPAFTGPWAEQFTQAYRASATDGQREMLEDGVVSDEEYAQVRNALVECMANFGATVTLEGFGRISIEQGDRLTDEQLNDEVLPDCEQRTTGHVAPLHEQAARNPENADISELVVACLQEGGLVDSGYTAGQYLDDLEANAGLDWFDPRVRSCVDDPLGLNK